MSKSEVNKDGIRLAVVSILYAVFFGITTQFPDNLSSYIGTIDFGLKLFAQQFAIIFAIPLLVYAALLGGKYSYKLSFGRVHEIIYDVFIFLVIYLLAIVIWSTIFVFLYMKTTNILFESALLIVWLFGVGYIFYKFVKNN